MNRAHYILAASLLAAGCQNPAWQNPYAAIGPVTVPPPGLQAAGVGGGAEIPTIEVPAARPSVGGPIRSEISAVPRDATSGTSGTAEPSFNTRDSGEPPIRIVEAAPTGKLSAAPAGSRPAAKPLREPPPPTVVAATPAGRTATSGVPAVKFNPSAAPLEMSQLPRPPATVPAATTPPTGQPTLNRTRGYIPAQAPVNSAPANAAPAAPRNRLSAPSLLRDPAVSPATFIETTTAANGQWKAR